MSSSWHYQDEAFFNVTEGIRKVIETIQEQLRKAEEEQLRKAEEEQLRKTGNQVKSELQQSGWGTPTQSEPQQSGWGTPIKSPKQQTPGWGQMPDQQLAAGWGRQPRVSRNNRDGGRQPRVSRNNRDGGRQSRVSQVLEIQVSPINIKHKLKPTI